MSTINKIVMVGFVSFEPKIETFTSKKTGKPFEKARVSLNVTTVSEDGVENKCYIDAQTFNREIIDYIRTNIKKDDRVIVEGKLEEQRWTDKDTGKQRSKHSIMMDSIVNAEEIPVEADINVTHTQPPRPAPQVNKPVYQPQQRPLQQYPQRKQSSFEEYE